MKDVESERKLGFKSHMFSRLLEPVKNFDARLCCKGKIVLVRFISNPLD